MMKRTELNVNFSQQWKPRGQDLVARGTLIRQGVFCGSRGCILHPGESIKNSVRDWNRVPVTLGHPRIGDDFVAASDAPDTIIGHLEAPAFRSNALIADIVITSQDQSVRRELQASREVSIGLFSDELPSEGVYNNLAYSLIAQNYKPDHLAILKRGETGACSWEDGCGVRTNQAALREAMKIYVNNLLTGGNNTMNIQPLLPPGVKQEKKMTDKELLAMQAEADRRGILLPIQFNRSIAQTKSKANTWSGEVEPLLPAGMN